MKKPITTLWCCLNLIFCSSYLFAQNALHFDGINDVVMIPNASSKIINSSNISMSCWVYATNTGGPHGILGFRNNLDADLYLLQLSNTSMECRYRSSTGINYDIVYNGYAINTWQHFVFTLDTDTLRLYHDGVEVAKKAAVGTITNSTVEMRIGNTPWNTSIFSTEGTMDEVTLWNKTISASEANCMYTNGVNPFATGLQLYYDFNQGTANGSNSGITTLIDRTGNINGTLNNFSLSGTTSNWVNGVAFPNLISQTICLGDSVVLGSKAYYTAGTYFDVTTASNGCDSITSLVLDVNAITESENASFCAGDVYSWRSKSLTAAGTYFDTLQSAAICDTVFQLKLTERPEYNSTLNEVICNGESYTLGSQVLTTEGSYSETFNTIYGCDSTINVNLDVDTVNIGVTLNSGTLIAGADQTKYTYQWYDCNTGLEVPNETNKFFNVPNTTPPGAYAVIVTSIATNCTDTSACFGQVVGIGDHPLDAALSLLPNPANESVQILLGSVYNQVSVDFLNSGGQVVLNRGFSNTAAVKIDVEMLAAGVYFVRVTADQEMTVTKLLKR